MGGERDSERVKEIKSPINNNIIFFIKKMLWFMFIVLFSYIVFALVIICYNLFKPFLQIPWPFLPSDSGWSAACNAATVRSRAARKAEGGRQEGTLLARMASLKSKI